MLYERALEELGVLRQEMVEMEEPGVWNEYLHSLKRKLLAGELGGDRREMWEKVRKGGARLGLIEKKVSKVSEVSEEEAKEVSEMLPPSFLFFFDCLLSFRITEETYCGLRANTFSISFFPRDDSKQYISFDHSLRLRHYFILSLSQALHTY